jgi:xanthine dehydrogenase accessory factor
MITQSMLDKLTESLNLRKECFLVTISAHPDKEMLGLKALFWSNGDFYCESPHFPAMAKPIFSSSQRLMQRKKSGTSTFLWNGSEAEFFAEYFPVPIHLIIAGAGHVCEPVAEMGKMLDFYVTVLDDRKEFANRDRFPYVDEVVCQPYLEYFKEAELTEYTYILLLTRGHKYDVLSLQELLKRKEKPAYIGMIGSRRRISGVFEELKQDFPEESFDQLYTPVGLDIGAETPSEIAVSIMAEILKIKNNKSGHSLSSKIRDYAKLGFREGAVK